MAKLIIISGPTASGKTKSSILLAKIISAEIVNFDSLLFYKDLNIGTAKPTTEEMDGIPHHLINISDLKNPLNASEYILMAENKIEDILKKGTDVILVGGSAFYLRALIKGMYDGTHISKKYREEIELQYAEEGIGPFSSFLSAHDPDSFNDLHRNDHYRLLRAYEYFKSTGLSISKQKNKLDEKDPYDFSKNNHPNWKITHIYIDLPKDEHYQIIQTRTREMVSQGLVAEVKGLLRSGFTGKERPLGSIGYKETLRFLNGEFSSEDEYMERISISTRQLAKSQRTFFKKITPKLEYNSHQFIQQLESKNIDFLTL